MTSNIDKVMASRCRLGGYYLVANVVWLSRGWIHTTCPFSSLYLPEFACIGWTVQGKYWSMGSEDTHAGMTLREQEDRLSACCVCGCEDNEFFEPLVQPCSCAGCALLAHTSCITTVKGGASQKEQRLQRSGVCCFCGTSVKDGVSSDSKLQKGGRWVEEVPDTGNGKLVKGDQLGVARKRLRSTSGGSAVPFKAELGEKLSIKSSRNEKGSNLVHSDKVQPEVSPTDLKKSSSPFLGRRFSDAAANVPIKKRRIQLEMARSPSPPPGTLKHEPGIAAVHEVIEVTKPSGSQTSEVNAPVATELDGNGGGSLESFASAEVHKFDPKAPEAALNISEEDLIKGDKQMSPPVTAPETYPEGGVVVGRSSQLGQSNSFVGCKSEKGDAESEQRKGNRCITENGTSPAENRRTEATSLISSQVDVQSQILAVHTGSTSPTREGQQACAIQIVVMPEHLLSSGLSEVGRAGEQSEEVVTDSSRDGGATLSPNSKRKFSETDMSHPMRDHLEESSRSRPVNRAGNVNFQTCMAGSMEEEHVHTPAPHGSGMMEASTQAGKNNSSRDVRLHWDLNMDMEEWERPSEEDNAVASVQSLSSIPNIEVKMESLPARKFDEESHEGAAASTSTSSEDGRLEQKCPPQDSSDAVRKINAAEVGGGSLKSEMKVERKDKLILTPSDSAYYASLKLGEDQLKEAVPAIPSGGISGTHTVKEAEGKPEVVCYRVEGDKSTSALQKDNRHTELEVAPASDQEAEALHSEGLVSAVGPVVDKETKGRVFLVAEKGKTDVDVCRSELTDTRADTSVHEEEDTCGTYSLTTDNFREETDVLQLEKKPESHVENVSHLVHSEGTMIPTPVPTSAVPVAELSSIRNVTGLQGCDDSDAASHEDEKLVDKEVVEEFVTDRNQSPTSPSRQAAPLKWEGDNGEDLEAEDVDYGDSDLREGDDHDMEDRLQRGASEVESTWNPYGDTKISEVQGGATAPQSQKGNADDSSNVMGTRKRRYGSEITAAEEFQGMDVEKAHAVHVDDLKCGSIPGKSSISSEMNGGLAVEEEKVRDDHGNGSASVATSDSRRASLERTEDLIGTPRSDKAIRKSEVWREPSEGGSRVRTKSGWDQLPEGFQSAEEALQAARPNAGQTGWGSHYAPGFSGWNGSSSIHFNPSENRYLPGHGRGMLPGPAADRVSYEKTGWSRGDHPRRSRVDDGLEIHGRVPVNQELRQSSGNRPRPSSLEPAHRQRRRGIWGEDAGVPPPMWGFGPGRHLSPPGPSREPYGFHPHKTRNAAAVAAAKVESSGLVVAPDGTVIKAGVGAPAPLRGLGGKGRGAGFSSMSDMTSNGVMTGVGNTGLSHSLRIAGDVDLRSRECLGVDSRVAGGIGMGIDPPHFKRVGERFGASFPPGMGSSMARGASPMLGTSSRYRWTREERSYVPPVEQEDRNFPGKRRSVDRGSLPQSSRSRVSTPPRPTTSNEVIPDDGAASQARKSRVSEVVDAKLEAEPEVAPAAAAAESDSQTALQVVPPPPKLPLPPPPPRAQRSPPAGLKRLINKREDWPRGRERSRDKEREWDRERASSRGHYSPSRRSSPHVIHGSALTDERDRLLLAGIDRNRDGNRDQGASASISGEDVPSYRGRSMEDSHERRGRHYDGDAAVKSRAQSKDSTYRGGDAKESRSDTDSKSDRRRDCQKSGVNYKHSSSREGEDDVAPRRRRPS
ncbi:hypothetical protein KC19_12G092600 [Ceratodon purpureus]|uniref:Uncharacterized protein n=1 Tax=Ceratodon purpureus TaxID=3225 RepID=A0A8T0G590_CERPU|nr:hypothetical protein KC19_12G092600 [Ceratodon purpureus]